jgi:enoyl-CoA hydratase/carnithine racemase
LYNIEKAKSPECQGEENMGDQFVQIQHVDEMAVITLTKGVTNAIDGALVAQLSAALHTAAHDPQMRGIILTSSSNKFFSIGFDIPSLYRLPREEIVRFYNAFVQVCMELYTLPKPSVVAISGHALAGGCILALCCDQRLIADGRKLMGLNEVKLGIPVPFIAECILRQLLRGRDARQVLETGDFYAPEQLLAMGLVDRIEPTGRLLAAAMETARSLASPPLSAYAAIKHSRTQSVQAEVSAKQEERDRILIDSWYSQEARQLLRVAMEKF